jgi:hypothetical protein
MVGLDANESQESKDRTIVDDSVWMSDITYAAVEIVRFMNPEIRTRHQDPRIC